jgi:hypothetical protein
MSQEGKTGRRGEGEAGISALLGVFRGGNITEDLVIVVRWSLDVRTKRGWKKLPKGSIL